MKNKNEVVVEDYNYRKLRKGGFFNKTRPFAIVKTKFVSYASSKTAEIDCTIIEYRYLLYGRTIFK